MTLRDAALACGAVCDVVQRCLGPAGQDCLLSLPDGQIFITGSGSSVLSALSTAHPVARLLVKAALNHHRVHGDGSIRFVVMATYMLRQAAALERSTASRSHVVRLITNIMQSGLPRAEAVLHEAAANQRGPLAPSLTAADAVRAACTSSLATRVAPGPREILAQILNSALFLAAGPEPTATAIRGACNDILSHWDLVVLPDIQPAGLGTSRVVPGCIIECQGPSTFSADGAVQRVLVVCIRDDDDCDGDDGGESRFGGTVFSGPAGQVLTQLMAGDGDGWWCAQAARCQSLGVNAVVTTGRAPGALASALLHHGIELWQQADCDDVDRLCTSLGCQPAASWEEPLAKSHAADVRTCQPITLGSLKGLHIAPSHTKSPTTVQIVLSASSRSILRHYQETLHSAFKCASMVVQGPAGAAVVPGAGAAEAAVALSMCKPAKLFGSTATAATGEQLFARTVAQVPLQLALSLSGTASRQAYDRLFPALSACLARREYHWGVGAGGKPYDTTEFNVCEPLQSVLARIGDVVACVLQVARIDAIVSVRRPLHPAPPDDPDN
eukprot:m.137514 g.137514  ORF g.137514 m.137514 type:complete len:556 (+) comp16999_c0_seq4:144-1811(+)